MEFFMNKLHGWWIIFGMRVLGYKYALPYVPNKDDDFILAITFSYREDYITKIRLLFDEEASL